MTGAALVVEQVVEQAPELTILMPCLNEAETVATCVGKAHGFLAATGWPARSSSPTTAAPTAAGELAAAGGAGRRRSRTRATATR